MVEPKSILKWSIKGYFNSTRREKKQVARRLQLKITLKRKTPMEARLQIIPQLTLLRKFLLRKTQWRKKEKIVMIRIFDKISWGFDQFEEGNASLVGIFCVHV